jgi:hypothetical protein
LKADFAAEMEAMFDDSAKASPKQPGVAPSRAVKTAARLKQKVIE